MNNEEIKNSESLKRLCRICNEVIHPERLEVLPNTQTCTIHSQVNSVPVGFMSYSHKTAPDLVIVQSSNEEGLRQARNAFNRKR